VICCLGDLLLDVVVSLPGPVQAGTDTYSEVEASAGGQAANVAAWVAALGGKARLVAKRARDPVGNLVESQVRALGVEVVGPVTKEGRTGTVVSLSWPGGERSMLTDRGVSPHLEASELDKSWFTGCEWLHLPFYSLSTAPIRQAALQAAEWCPQVSVDLSSVAVLLEAGPTEVAQLLKDLHPSVIFANEAEIAVAGVPAGPTVVTKLGQHGVLVNGEHFPALAADALDTTGAGDAFAAGFLIGGAALGLDAAARAVQRRGAMPFRKYH
jgi:ribokinase